MGKRGRTVYDSRNQCTRVPVASVSPCAGPGEPQPSLPGVRDLLGPSSTARGGTSWPMDLTGCTPGAAGPRIWQPSSLGSSSAWTRFTSANSKGVGKARQYRAEVSPEFSAEAAACAGDATLRF
ncbi:hypothetical protein MPNT_70092 [Candidatus Methylacidithermus pantelleriae]|uniref:Uncharacterized protein n=1 Tax=Candidatus Methylacidithermus pantelleriae TaxID=2744239 RepID=A0A8J2BSP8_9BACT|nr:hypothetical protein MPNT_70092 [Candidatus Methylacidithermus pantelleriae]